MNQIYHELSTCWNGPDVIIVAADEVRIEHEAILRSAWHPTKAPQRKWLFTEVSGSGV